MLHGSMRLRAFSLGLALLGSLAASASAFANTLSYQSSSPQDWVGQGQSLSFTEGVTATASTDKRHISVAVNTPDHWYFLDLAAPVGQELMPGTYEGAVRYPFGESWQPQLSFGGDGRGCNTLTGSFVINSVKIGAYGYVESLDATWIQSCEGFMPPLYGQVSINNPPQPEALVFNLTASSTGTVPKHGGVATVSGTVKCSVGTTANLYVSLSQTVPRKGQAYASTNLSVPCGPTMSTWSANLVSQTAVVFGAGQGQLDVNANAYDPNYGGQQSQSASTVVNLSTVKRTVMSAKGKPVRN